MRRLVYILGNFGAYSEINNLLLAHAYAGATGARLVIDGRAWSARTHAGWRDYFETGTTLGWPMPVVPDHRYWHGGRRGLRARLIDRASLGRLVLMPDYWQRMRDPDFWLAAGVTAADGANSLFARKQAALKALYRFNRGTRAATEAVVAGVGLPASYAAVHIRCGDKISSGEMAPVEIAGYVARLDFLASDDIFVATDDHDALLAFMRLLPPGKRVYSLCVPTARGHVQQDFNDQSAAVRREEMIRLFAEVEILSAADRFLCTFSSNLSRFVALRIGLENCLSLDEDWHPW